MHVIENDICKKHLFCHINHRKHERTKKTTPYNSNKTKSLNKMSLNAKTSDLCSDFQ